MAPDPSGFSGSEWAARFIDGAGKGLGQGMQNYQQQNAMMRQGGGGMPSTQTLPGSNLQFGTTNFTPGMQQGPPGNNGSAWPSDTQTNAKWGKNPFFYGYGQ